MKILVTGATGIVGSRVVHELQHRGVSVRAFARDTAKAANLLGDGVELACGDLADAASVRRALQGVDRVFLACANHPRQVAYEIGVIEAAREAGIRRMLKLSALGAEIGSPVAFWDWHAQIERHLEASGIPAVVLRPSFNMTNLLGSAEQIKCAGSLFVPANGARVAMIDPTDVAAVAAVALTEDGHDGETYTLTGPEAISFERVAEELSNITNRPIQFVAVPDEAAQHALEESGMPEFVAGQIVAVFSLLRRGIQDYTTDTVRAIIGRSPHTFVHFAHEYADIFQSPPVPPLVNADLAEVTIIRA
jgi:uncharacterized protein YbjT (DUF2867 family)